MVITFILFLYMTEKQKQNRTNLHRKYISYKTVLGFYLTEFLDEND